MWQKMLQVGSGGGGELKFTYYTSLETTSDTNKKILHTEKSIKGLVGIWDYNDSLTVFYYDPNVNENKWYRRVNGESNFSEKNFNLLDEQPQGLYNISNDRKTITFYTYNNERNVFIITLE